MEETFVYQFNANLLLIILVEIKIQRWRVKGSCLVCEKNWSNSNSLMTVTMVWGHWNWIEPGKLQRGYHHAVSKPSLVISHKSPARQTVEYETTTLSSWGPTAVLIVQQTTSSSAYSSQPFLSADISSKLHLKQTEIKRLLRFFSSFLTLFFFSTALSHWDFPHGKFWLLFLGKASCDRVVLPNPQCMLGVSVFPYSTKLWHELSWTITK